VHTQSLPAAAEAASAAYEASAANTAARERATAELLAASRRIMSGGELATSTPLLAPGLHTRAGSAGSLLPRSAPQPPLLHNHVRQVPPPLLSWQLKWQCSAV
jgi:hypothetical protein